MAVELNHTIVAARNSELSAQYVADLLGLPPPTRFGPFQVLDVANGVSLDYIDSDEEIASQHYAFLVSEQEFDDIFGRIVELDLVHWADPGRRQAGEINHNDGGRGCYFEDLDGHFLEIITRPYGGG